MVSYEVSWACPLQPAPPMFIDDAHILRAPSATVWACISKRPAIARIACESVIKRVVIGVSLPRKLPVVKDVAINSESPKIAPPSSFRTLLSGSDCVGRLGGRIGFGAHRQRLDEHLVNRLGLGADRLIHLG